MSEEKVKDDLYQRVEEHLQELLEPELPEARLSPGERLELLEQARSSESCRELLEAYEKTISLVSALPDKPVPVDFGAKVGETIEADTPVIPFYKTELFQRMLGAVGAIALIAMVFWDAFPPAVEESPLQLADNVARPGAARENLAEEIESLGRSERYEIESRLKVLLVHLLKWRYQPQAQSNGWKGTIREQRARIARRIGDSPSLRGYPEEILADEYSFAVPQAADETGLSEDAFPAACPFTVEQILDPGFLPDAP